MAESILDVMDQAPRQDQVGPAKRVLTQVHGENPDEFARDLGTARKLGLPPDVVAGDRAEAERALFTRDPVFDAMDQAPKTSEWLQNPDNARLAHDDLQTLVEFERAASRPWYSVDERAMKGWADSALIGMGKTWDSAMAAILAESPVMRDGYTPEDFLRDPLGSLIGGVTKMTSDAILGEEQVKMLRERTQARIDQYTQNLEFADQLIGEATPEGLTVMEEGIRGGIQMIADMAPGMIISGATRGRINPTLPYLTGKTYLDSYGSAITEGKDHQTAKQYATIDAAIEFATEKLPTQQLERIFGELGSGGVKSKLKKWMVTEAGTEQLATAGQSINAYLHDLDEELANASGPMEALEIQGRRQAVTFISTLVGGGSISATAGTLDHIATRRQRAFQRSITRAAGRVNSEQEQDRLDQIISLAQSAKVNERDQEAWKDFVRKVGEEQRVYISAAAVREMEDAPEYLVAQLDGSNGDIEMTMEQFATEIATNEDRLALARRHIKTAEHLQTQEEMEADTDTDYIKNLLSSAESAQAARTEAEQIYAEVTEQLVATGRQSEAFARHSAQLIPALVSTQYENLKAAGITNEDGSEITVKQLFDDMGLRVVGPKAKVSEQATFVSQAESAGLVVAYKGADGTVVVGRPGQIHGQLADESGMPLPAEGEMGFADEQGRFMNRKEALSFVQQQFPDYNPPFAEPELESQHYARFTASPRILAQAEQSEYEAAVAKGLDMSQAGRLARAKTIGFDVGRIFYHGTSRDFTEIRRGQDAIFVSSDPAISEDYAGSQGSIVPVYIRRGDIFDWGNPEHVARVKEKYRNYLNDESQLEYAFEQFELESASYGGTPAIQGTNLQEAIKDAGFSGFEVGIEKAVALFNPADVRSVNAAFDPDFAASPRILAQQDLAGIRLRDTRVDSAGNTVDIIESAQSLWDDIQSRLGMVEQLRECMSA